jgi:hypothetical protein
VGLELADDTSTAFALSEIPCPITFPTFSFRQGSVLPFGSTSSASVGLPFAVVAQGNTVPHCNMVVCLRDPLLFYACRQSLHLHTKQSWKIHQYTNCLFIYLISYGVARCPTSQLHVISHDPRFTNAAAILHHAFPPGLLSIGVMADRRRGTFLVSSFGPTT